MRIFYASVLSGFLATAWNLANSGIKQQWTSKKSIASSGACHLRRRIRLLIIFISASIYLSVSRLSLNVIITYHYL